MQITDEMVDKALNAWFASPPSETDQGLERSMRAALEAAFEGRHTLREKDNANDDRPIRDDAIRTFGDVWIGLGCRQHKQEPR